MCLINDNSCLILQILQDAQKLSPLLNFDSHLTKLRTNLTRREAEIHEGSSVHVSICEATTMLKKTKTEERLILSEPVTTTIAIVSDAHGADIKLPQSFNFEDGLHCLRLESKAVSDGGIFLNAIRNIWEEGKERLREANMAQHALYYLQQGPGFYTMEWSFKNSIMRWNRKKGEERGGNIPVDIKCRNRDQKSLTNHLKHSPNILDKFRELQEGNPEADVSTIIATAEFDAIFKTICDSLPISYQYPTIGIKHSLLPNPNCLGASSKWVKSFDNDAHMRFASSKWQAKSPIKEEVFKVLHDLIMHDASNKA